MQHERIKALDGLRAFAIILVLLCHCTRSLHTLGVPTILKIGAFEFHQIFYNGWMGVELFFVLSGFLITSQLLTKPVLQGNIKKFLIKRFFRIAPAYYVSVFLIFLHFHVIPEINETSLSEFLAVWWWPLLAHFIFLHDFMGRLPIIDGVFWSIPIEMKFYIILPFFVFLLNKIKSNRNKVISIFVFFFTYLGLKTALIYQQYGFETLEAIDYYLYVKSPFYFALEGLITGVLCAYIVRHEQIKKIKPHSPVMHCTFLVGLLIYLTVSMQSHFTDLPYAIDTHVTFFEMVGMSGLVSFGFGLIVIASVKGCFFTKVLESVHLEFIAKISYSLYLVHVLALCVLGLYNFHTSTLTLWLISIPSFFILSTCLACLLHIFVEKPFIDWSKRKFKYTE